MRGVFSFYKPVGPTSNQFILKIKKILKEKKIGHAGTLDPLAEGVLVVGIGREATKKLGKIVKEEKEYQAIIFLGKESLTYDREGVIEQENRKIKKIPSLRKIKKVLSYFEGKIFQTPPIFSAIKVKGQEAYKRARKGEKINLPPRLVFIKKIEFEELNWPFLKIKVTTGPGVYIRSLANDIGKKLGVGGYLYSLIRTRVGNFRIENAMGIKDLKEISLEDKNLSN